MSCKSCSVEEDYDNTKCKNCNTRIKHNEHGEIREDFCSSCLVVPLVLAGAGATGVSLSTSKKNKMRKKVLLIAGVITILSAVIIGVYYLKNKESCLECIKK